MWVEVFDNGSGGAEPKPGSGLEGLRERVEQAGGSLRLTSPQGRGTRIEASIPATPR
jgi:signal transduction histidine kinase